MKNGTSKKRNSVVGLIKSAAVEENEVRSKGKPFFCPRVPLQSQEFLHKGRKAGGRKPGMRAGIQHDLQDSEYRRDDISAERFAHQETLSRSCSC